MSQGLSSPALPAILLLGALVGCSGGDKADAPATPATPKAQAARDPLEGGPFPALLLAQAWFLKGPDGRPAPQPARLQIWRDTGSGWTVSHLEDPDSNVFHKAMAHDGGIVTIGAEKAMLKKWTFQDGEWQEDLLWEQSWGGRFDRLRDLEIGDVTGDGEEELVIATHDAGVVAVYRPNNAEEPVLELDRAEDTFVHEVEIGDVLGDGTNQFFVTPSARNKAGASQEGGIAMYRWDGEAFKRTWVDHSEHTHAKEILVADVDGDGKDELFGVMEAELGEDRQVKTPVQLRLYRPQEDGTFSSKVIASIEDRQTRFLVAGDFDQDGEVELVAAAMKSGLWLLSREGGPVDGPWKTTLIDANTGGFEHVAKAADLDGDGKLELYVADDENQKLRRYVWNEETGAFDMTVLGDLPADTFTWNMEPARL